jgi:hypothetical protein
VTLRHPRIRDIALDTKLYDDGRRVEAVASWNGLRSRWCRLSETGDPLPSGEVAQCQRRAIRMLRILVMGRQPFNQPTPQEQPMGERSYSSRPSKLSSAKGQSVQFTPTPLRRGSLFGDSIIKQKA